MKILINIIAFISFGAQFVAFIFSALNQKNPQSTAESFYNDFVFIAYLCSLFAIAIFVILYNFDYKLLKKKTLNILFLMIVLLGIYIHLSQLLLLNDFMLLSCILLLFDIYSIYKIQSCLFSKFNH